MLALKLDTPHSHNPGHGAPVASYTHVGVIQYAVDELSGEVQARVTYGNVVKGEFSPAPISPVIMTIRDIPAHTGPGNQPVPADTSYTDFMDKVTIDADKVRDATKRALFEKLQETNAAAYAGTIEDPSR